MRITWIASVLLICVLIQSGSTKTKTKFVRVRTKSGTLSARNQKAVKECSQKCRGLLDNNYPCFGFSMNKKDECTYNTEKDHIPQEKGDYFQLTHYRKNDVTDQCEAGCSAYTLTESATGSTTLSTRKSTATKLTTKKPTTAKVTPKVTAKVTTKVTTKKPTTATVTAKVTAKVTTKATTKKVTSKLTTKVTPKVTAKVTTKVTTKKVTPKVTPKVTTKKVTPKVTTKVTAKLTTKKVIPKVTTKVTPKKLTPKVTTKATTKKVTPKVTAKVTTKVTTKKVTPKVTAKVTTKKVTTKKLTTRFAYKFPNVEFRGSLFYFDPRNSTLAQCREICKNEKMTLVSIHSIAENEFVRNTVCKHYFAPSGPDCWPALLYASICHLGITLNVPGKKWTFMDGSSPGYRNGTFTYTQGSCVHMRCYGDWNEINCGEVAKCVCRRKL